MKLIVISPSSSQEGEEEIVTRMFEEGLPLFHLRKPRMSTFDTDRYLKKIPAHFHSRIVLHYHHILATKYSLYGIHYSSHHLKRKFYNLWVRFRLKLKLRYLIKSTSVYSLRSAYSLEKNAYDYVFLGNLFNNITGKFIHEFTTENVQALIRQLPDVSWIARGGTTPKTISLCYEMKFAGIAFQSWIWKSENPLEKFKIIQKEFSSLGITPEK